MPMSSSTQPVLASNPNKGRGSDTIYAPRRSKNYLAVKCDICIRLFKWFPVVFIAAVLGWGWYAYVIQLCFLTMESVILRVICIVIFNFLYAMVFWSYFQTVMTDVGRVPRDFWLTVNDLQRLGQESTDEGRKQTMEDIVASRNLPVACRTYTSEVRLCEKCNLVKPDRAHHCSVCDCCVLKMDHHCPWVNNCVSFTNYKFFVLFLGYSFSLCLFSAITSFQFFLRFWRNDLHNKGKLHVLFLFFVSIMFAISLVSLFGYHIFLTIKNRSTLEAFRPPVFRYGPDKRAYDLGRKRNWEQIFGDNKVLWFVPVVTSHGTGFVYECRATLDVEDEVYEEGRRPLLRTSDSDDQADQDMVTIDLKDVADYELSSVEVDSGPDRGDENRAVMNGTMHASDQLI